MQAATKVPKRSSLRRQLGKFIGSGDLLSLMLAVYLGESLGHFFNSLVTGAILPLIGTVINTLKGTIDKKHKGLHMAKWTADIHGANIEVWPDFSKFYTTYDKYLHCLCLRSLLRAGLFK